MFLKCTFNLSGVCCTKSTVTFSSSEWPAIWVTAWHVWHASEVGQFFCIHWNISHWNPTHSFIYLFYFLTWFLISLISVCNAILQLNTQKWRWHVFKGWEELHKGMITIVLVQQRPLKVWLQWPLLKRKCLIGSNWLIAFTGNKELVDCHLSGLRFYSSSMRSANALKVRVSCALPKTGQPLDGVPGRHWADTSIRCASGWRTLCSDMKLHSYLYMCASLQRGQGDICKN